MNVQSKRFLLNGNTIGFLSWILNLAWQVVLWNGPANPHPPQIKDEAARRAKTRSFPIFDFMGSGGGGGLGFRFIFSNFAILDRIKWSRKTHPLSPRPPTPKARTKPREGQKRAIFPSLILGGGSRVSIYFVQECGSRLEKVKVVFGLGQIGPFISQLQAI